MRRLRDCLLYNPSVVLTNDSTPASPAELHTGEPKMKKALFWGDQNEKKKSPLCKGGCLRACGDRGIVFLQSFRHGYAMPTSPFRGRFFYR